ncbi:DUF4148 domain-containing protein [Paraburkholderia dipogonis]|jgi:hypothetical protein
MCLDALKRPIPRNAPGKHLEFNPILSIRGIVMKIIIPVAFGILLSANSIASAFAQASTSPNDPSHPKTRSEVRADAQRWFAAGFDPLDFFHYPGTAMEASRMLPEQHGQAAVLTH